MSQTTWPRRSPNPLKVIYAIGVPIFSLIFFLSMYGKPIVEMAGPKVLTSLIAGIFMGFFWPVTVIVVGFVLFVIL